MRRLTLGLLFCLIPLSLLGCEDPDALVTGGAGKILKPATTTTTGPSGTLTDGDPVVPTAPPQDWSSGAGTPPPPDLEFTPTPQRSTDGTSPGTGSGTGSGGDGFLEEPDDTPGDGSGGGTVDPVDPGANDNQPGDVTEPGDPGTPGDTGSGPGSGETSLPGPTDP